MIVFSLALSCLISGQRFELTHWMDPQSYVCSQALELGRLGVFQTTNRALEQSQRNGTRWFYAALECPKDTLGWPIGGHLVVRLKGGPKVASSEVVVAGEGPQMIPYYPSHQYVTADRIHMLPPRGSWARPAWMLVGFPKSPAFELSEVDSMWIGGSQ
jgi:hypothetical protein